MMKTTTNNLRSSQKIFSTSSFLSNIQENNNNDDNNNANRNIININNENKYDRKDSKNPLKKSFKKLKSSKYSLKNNEEKNNKNFRIIKEIFDPKKYIVSEEELFRRGEGYCFGEWALIYKEPRAASIYTLEDCVFFTLDEIHFRNSFLKSLNNSEYSKKKFALQNFFPFDMMDERQLSIYKNIVPITCKRNQIIFNEGEISDSLFLIYLGSFTLEKKHGAKQFKVLNLERGSIVGLESIFEGENSKYKCSLKLSHGLDVGLIFQLKLDKLRPYIINKMKLCFKKNYNVFLKSWNDFFCKNVFIQQKMTNEKLGEFIGEKGKIEFDNYLNQNNNEQIEFNTDLINKINKNWKSVLNIEREDKYEVLFKDCLKKKFYNNYKKDGTLRILSSKQRNKMSGDLYNNNKNQKIIKFHTDKINSKSSNSNRHKDKNDLTINVSEINPNNKIFQAIQKNFNLTEINSNFFLLDYDEEGDNTIKNNNLLKNELSILNDEIKSKKIKRKNSFKSKHLKINQRLTNEQDIIKAKTPIIPKKKNKYTTIHFKANDLLNNDNIITPKDINIPKLNLNLEKEKNKDKQINNHIINNNNKIIINCNKNENILNNTNYSNLKKHKTTISRNNSIFLDNKNFSTSQHSFFNNFQINIPLFIKKNNKILFHRINSINSAKNINKNQLFNIDLASGEESSTKNKFIYENKGITSVNNKRYSSVGTRHLSPMNIKANNLFKIFKKDKSKTINIRSIKKNNIFDNNKIFKNIKNNHFSHRNKKYKSFISFEDSKDFYHELNLNNGFSVSYFEKINSIDSINNMKFINKYKPFPSPLNNFKFSFDSGFFKIPLISSNMKLAKF